MRSNENNLKHKKLPIGVTKPPFLLWGWSNTVTGCPEMMRNLHPWWYPILHCRLPGQPASADLLLMLKDCHRPFPEAPSKPSDYILLCLTLPPSIKDRTHSTLKPGDRKKGWNLRRKKWQDRPWITNPSHEIASGWKSKSSKGSARLELLYLSLSLALRWHGKQIWKYTIFIQLNSSNSS